MRNNISQHLDFFQLASDEEQSILDFQLRMGAAHLQRLQQNHQ